MGKQVVVQTRGAGERMRVLGTQLRFLCAADETDSAWSLMEVEMPKDAGPPLHEHPWDEAYYVLDGDVRFKIGADERLVSAGDFIYAPGGTLHGFQGASDRPARMLIFDAPAHAEGFFREVEREVKSLPADLPKVPDIGARHGMRFAQP